MNPLIVGAIFAFGIAIVVGVSSFARNIQTRGSSLTGARGKSTQIASFVLAGVFVVVFILAATLGR